MTSAAAVPYIPATPATPALAAPVSAVGPQFCMPHPIDLALNAKHMSLTDSVMDINGNVVFRVRGKLFSLHDKNTLLDSSGNTLLFRITKPIKLWRNRLHLPLKPVHRTWEAERKPTKSHNAISYYNHDMLGNQNYHWAKKPWNCHTNLTFQVNSCS